MCLNLKMILYRRNIAVGSQDEEREKWQNNLLLCIIGQTSIKGSSSFIQTEKNDHLLRQFSWSLIDRNISYLSCIDVLYSFSNLNTHLTALIVERGFYRHVNLSSARFNQFQSILSLLRFNEIQSVVIDCYASPFQLKYWPHLPDLRTLRVKGVRDLVDVFKFEKNKNE
jgi:hypothetical protein